MSDDKEREWRGTEAYFWSRVQRTDGCWVWTGTKNPDGYGRVPLDRHWKRTTGAHRLSYELSVGPIPTGLVIDHLCRNPGCVNPAHMEPVTARENTLRGVSDPARFARATHCKRGHELSGGNLKIRPYMGSVVRVCRACKTRITTEGRRRRAAERAMREAS